MRTAAGSIRYDAGQALQWGLYGFPFNLGILEASHPRIFIVAPISSGIAGTQ